MFPVVRYPYLVFYEVINNEVIIHHIRHGRRRPIDPSKVRSIRNLDLLRLSGLRPPPG